MKHTIHPILFTVTLAAALPVAGGATALPDHPFGFAGKEIFPINPQIGHLQVADFNGDGLRDLAVANNARSRISLLYNLTGKTNRVDARVASLAREINDLPPDARFEIQSLTSEQQISCLVAADLNADGRPDIACYGEPLELLVYFNEGDEKWSPPRRFAIPDGQKNLNGLVYGDLNADGRTDLLLLGENQIHQFLQDEAGRLADPVTIPFSGAVKGLQVHDINGDALDDLLLVDWENPYPVRFRLQDQRGRLGPEIHFAMPSIRSCWADDLDHDARTEIVTISSKSGRAQIASFVTHPAPALTGGFLAGQFQTLPLPIAQKGGRGTIWADIDGDDRVDLLFSLPDSGQLTARLQQADGSLGVSRTFPSLSGISEIQVDDWDADGIADIFLLSATEHHIGVTRMDSHGKIPFPSLLAVGGNPLAMTSGLINKDRPPQLAILTDQQGARALEIHGADGRIHRQALNPQFRSNPTAMSLQDADQDGAADLVVLIPYEKLKLLRQQSGTPDFEEIDLPPPGGNTSAPWISSADVDTDGLPELLLAQNNFVRAVVLSPKESAGNDGPAANRWEFSIKDQINGMSADSRIVAATALSLDELPVPVIFLLDAKYKSLTLCERDAAGVWKAVRNLEIPLSEFESLEPLRLGDDHRPCLALLGRNAVSWMALQGDRWMFEELDGFETTIDKGWLLDVIAGDLNGDDRKDLAFLEGGKNHIEIVQFDKQSKLKTAIHWQVFEKRSFRNQRNPSPEPREAAVADLTGDGRNDLVIIVHDRILLYPQE